MFYFFSKTLFYLLMPSTWLLVLLVYGVFTKNEKHRKRLLLIVFVLYIIVTNPYIASKTFHHWEGLPVPIATLDSTYDLGIVLTGVTNLEIEPHDRVYFNRGADRVLHTIQLYRMGKIKKILITGGGNPLKGIHRSETEELNKVFRLCGIPDSSILLETQAINTRENAQYVKGLLDQQHWKGKALLITSAFHMPRAKACFDKVGLVTRPFPVDFFTNSNVSFSYFVIFPTEISFQLWGQLVHEWIGFAVYKLVGYC